MLQALSCNGPFSHRHVYINTFLRTNPIPPPRSCSLAKWLANRVKDHQVLAYPDSIMDLLQSLTVPPAYPTTSRNILRRDPRLSYSQTAPSGQSSVEQSPLVPPTGPAPHQPPERESSSTPAKAKKRKKQKQKQKQKQSEHEEKSVATTAVLPTPATTTHAKRRKQYHLFHPDRPKSGANQASHVSYEDLYDDISDQPSIQPIPGSHASKSNPWAPQTCFFWYHGWCRRSFDTKGCQLRHALLDSPEKVVAPPRFVHLKPCKLEWCAGDGPMHKGQKANSGAEQKRYYEIGVSDDGSAQEGADQKVGDKSDFFLTGSEEPDA